MMDKYLLSSQKKKSVIFRVPHDAFGHSTWGHILHDHLQRWWLKHARVGAGEKQPNWTRVKRSM